MSEKLSNLLDKDAAQSDLDDFLRECSDDPSLIDSWQRYHLASAVIRNEIGKSDIKYDVAAKVMASLNSEQLDAQQSSKEKSNAVSLAPAIENATTTEPLTENPGTSTPGTSKPGAVKTRASTPWLPMALAASMLLGLYFIFQQPVLESAPQQVADQVANQVAKSGSVDNTLSHFTDDWHASSPEVEDVLNSLLVEHSEFTSVTGMNGLGSYSKFIAYQN